MKKQLQDQTHERDVKREAAKKESNDYHKVLMAHCEVLDQRENEKAIQK